MRRLNYRNGQDIYTYFVDFPEVWVVGENYDPDIPYVCMEYETIAKIRKNENGYFDFSKNIIDIGACHGDYSMLLDFKEQYCFEPNKTTSALLWTNAYLREKTETAHIYNVCLSDINGTVDFNGYCCEGSNSPDETNGIWGEMKPCETKALDSYNIKNVGFIKIDVEGFEEKVIRGGLLTIIGNDYPPILFECWRVGDYNMTQEKHDSLFNLLRTLGYEIFEYWGDGETHLAVHKPHINN